MAGWRIGMAVGNAQVLSYLHTMKSQIDSSNFEPLLMAGAAALTGDQDWTEERNFVYQTRRDIIVDALRKSGFSVQAPPAAIYVWARLPEGETDSTAFCNRMLDETGISMTPGVVYGPTGEGYLRISLGTPTNRVREAMNRLQEWVKK
jgi:LL-diaminopimelate aminotransferase